MKTPNELIESYDKLASEYAERFCDELEGKPFDRNLLQRFADDTDGGPEVLEYQPTSLRSALNHSPQTLRVVPSLLREGKENSPSCARDRQVYGESASRLVRRSEAKTEVSGEG